MPVQPRKMSEIMKEMSETLLRHPRRVPSSEGAVGSYRELSGEKAANN